MIRLAAIADLHCYADVVGEIRRLLSEVNERADVLLLPGDLTFGGGLDEADILIQELRDVEIPIIAVLGNHDFQVNLQRQILSRLKARGVVVLDGNAKILRIRGETVGFVGVKGFCGGFAPYVIAEYGESNLKEFVRSGRIEVNKLHHGLSGLRSEHRVVVLHYSPVKETVIGEPPELHPFLGSSALSDPVDQFGADVIFHGHAHFGSPFGRTKTGTPVYNVALPVVRRCVYYHLGNGAPPDQTALH